jgi:putative radical SAM enzyme (TIGR03279 family)
MPFGENKMKHTITQVEPNSIADELGIVPGDILLRLNGKPVQDVLDFRFFCASEELLIEIEKPGGEIWELEIEKDEQEELGLSFDNALMDKPTSCQNKCIFCFIDQNPKGMRESLYFKDDDIRLSFFTGNYVTLTNTALHEIDRIASYHLSPLKISIHATDLDLRKRMMGAACPLFEYLKKLNDAGITLHFQIVLCKGINDGMQLDKTIGALLALQPGATSLSVVPAGLTQYRDGLFPLESFTADEASQVIKQVTVWQEKCFKAKKNRFVFCADEWYLLAGIPLPEYKYYEDFPQLENGVGMMALFEKDFNDTLSEIGHSSMGYKTGIVTGQAAAGFMRKLIEPFLLEITIYEIKNKFYGPGITVSGLLTGGDIINQIKGKIDVDVLFVPQNAFKSNETIMRMVLRCVT